MNVFDMDEVMQTFSVDLADYPEFARPSHLHAKLFKIIRNGLRDKAQPALNENDLDWAQLDAIVCEYLHLRRFWAGFLNKTQAEALKVVRQRATKLSKDLERLREANASWFLERTLAEKCGVKVDLTSLRAALDACQCLEPNCPKFDAKPCQMPSTDERGEGLLRAALQKRLDTWWQNNTGLSKRVSRIDGTRSDYGRFLACLFSRMTIVNPPGASETVVKEARRVLEHRAEAKAEWREDFADAFRRWEALRNPGPGFFGAPNPQN